MYAVSFYTFFFPFYSLSDATLLLGCPSFLPLLKELCHLTGDALIIHRYQRLLPLICSKKALHSLRDVKDGDCIVAFSRKEIHKLKAQIEVCHPHLSCYMVYGNLPPEARKEQARLFNYASKQSSSKGTVLVASDAIGDCAVFLCRSILYSNNTRSMHRYGAESFCQTHCDVKVIEI